MSNKSFCAQQLIPLKSTVIKLAKLKLILRRLTLFNADALKLILAQCFSCKVLDNLTWQTAQLIVADVEPIQFGELPNFRWQTTQLITFQVEALQVSKLSNFLWQIAQLNVAESERLQVSKLSNFPWQTAQFIPG